MLAEHLQALARCVELLGLGCLSEQAMSELIKIMLKTLQEHYERQGEREKKRKDEDYDEGVEEQLEEEDDDDVFVLSKLGDLLHALFSTHKDAMIPVFDQLLPSVVKLLVRLVVFKRRFHSQPLQTLGFSLFRTNLTRGPIINGAFVSLMTLSSSWDRPPPNIKTISYSLYFTI